MQDENDVNAKIQFFKKSLFINNLYTNYVKQTS